MILGRINMKSLLKIIALSLISLNVLASVTINNTRIIYPSNSQGKDVVFNNNDESEYIIQTWVDKGNEASLPEDADGDFILMPAVFKIEKKSTQVLRMIYSGKLLPIDRESIFYLNYLQLPLVKSDKNQILVILKSRVKILYRPNELNGSLITEVEKLKIKVEDGNLLMKNDSGYYFNIDKISIKDKKSLANNVTISPFSTFKINVSVKKTDDIQVLFINDQGGNFNKSFKISTES